MKNQVVRKHSCIMKDGKGGLEESYRLLGDCRDHVMDNLPRTGATMKLFSVQILAKRWGGIKMEVYAKRKGLLTDDIFVVPFPTTNLVSPQRIPNCDRLEQKTYFGKMNTQDRPENEVCNDADGAWSMEFMILVALLITIGVCLLVLCCLSIAQFRG